jgi:hypothetical protein
MSHNVYKGRSFKRLLPGAVIIGVTAGSALLVGDGAASADPPAGTLGGNTVAPDPGTNTDAMRSTTGGGCPSPSVKADVKVVGPIGVDPAQQVFPATNPYTAVTITDTQFSNDGAFTQQWALTFQDAVATRLGATATVPTGEYDFTTRCLDRLGQHTLGTYVGGLFFDTPTTYHGLPSTTSTSSPTPTPAPTGQPTPAPSPTPTPAATEQPTPAPTEQPTPAPTEQLTPAPTSAPTPTPTSGSGATPTTTALRVIQIPLPFGLGGFVIPVAIVTPNATGTVQFKDGTTDLGSPAQVIGAFSLGSFFVLPVGSHTLTAEFIPADQTSVLPSTSTTASFTFGANFLW